MAQDSDGNISRIEQVYLDCTDATGVVYHTKYLEFMERARTDWLHAHDLQHTVAAREHGLIFVVSRLDVAYLRPAELEEKLKVTAKATRVNGATIEFEQGVWLANTALHKSAESGGLPAPACYCRAHVRVAALSADSMTPQRLPKALLERIGRGGQAG